MATPITWRNVNQPNFSASNTLALAASKQLGNAFDSGSQRLIDQGQYNEEQNNDAFAAKLAQYSNYDDLSGAKADLFSGLEGTNVDTSAALESYNKYSDRLGQNEIFALDRGERQRTETDRVAVDAALGQLSKGFTADSPSMTEDDIRDLGTDAFLTPSQQARYMEQALPVYGSTSEQKAAAATTKEVKMELLKNKLKIDAETAKQAAIDANDTNPLYGKRGNKAIKHMDSEPNVDKDDNAYTQQAKRVRDWDANEGRKLIDDTWVTIPPDVWIAAQQMEMDRTNSGFLDYFINDDTNYNEQRFDEDVLQILRDKRSATNDFDD